MAESGMVQTCPTRGFCFGQRGATEVHGLAMLLLLLMKAH